jgi:hypothetical protein
MFADGVPARASLGGRGGLCSGPGSERSVPGRWEETAKEQLKNEIH